MHNCYVMQGRVVVCCTTCDVVCFLRCRVFSRKTPAPCCFLDKIADIYYYLVESYKGQNRNTKMPAAYIKYDLNKEVKKFLVFLRHPRFPQHRDLIFKALPELGELLGKERNLSEVKEGAIIKSFIVDFRRKHAREIQHIVKSSEKLLKAKIEKSSTALFSLMDYKPKKGPIYKIIPTILPFSPFERNVFYFSILGALRKKEQRDVVFVSIHEISHIILYKILEKEYKKPISKVIDSTLLDFFKEILAPVLMNQEPLVNLLHLKDYLGNPFLRHIFVLKNNKKIQITQFFQKIYENERYKNKLKFSQILKVMLSLILSVERELEEKNKIWNQYGNSIVNSESAFKLYSKPIKIKMPGEKFRSPGI